MEALRVFNNPQFGDVRVIIYNEQPLFSASDVCTALGYSNPRDAVSRHVDSEDVAKHDTLTAGGTQLLAYVNESGMYALAFGSKLEGAKQFKKWVTSEVLPSIRKNGMYATDVTIDKMVADPDFAIKLLTNYKEERQKRLEAEQQTAIKEQQIAENAPKVQFANALTASNSSIPMGTLSTFLQQNGVKTGRNRLFDWLRDNKYLISEGERKNQPTQKSMELGLFEMKSSVITENGVSVTKMTTKVTGKGQQYFINKFLTVKSS